MSMQSITDQGHGIYTIDTGFQRKGLVASHLLRQGDRCALIDVGTTSCLATIRDAMAALEVEPEQVEYVIVTHVHLDHAGAAGSLLQVLPEARLVVHPRGARHMIDPSRLIAGAAAVYGEAYLKATFGDIVPVAAHRVIEAGDGFTLQLNGRELLFIDTPGHARHHFCVYDHHSHGFFTGDTFGLAYADLAVGNRRFVFPTTTPVQFDPDALHESIDRIMAYHPRNLYLTHFGRLDDPQRAAQQLHQLIDAHVNIARQFDAEAEECETGIKNALRQLLTRSLHEFGIELEQDKVLAIMEMDLRLNAQGLCCWLQASRHS